MKKKVLVLGLLFVLLASIPVLADDFNMYIWEVNPLENGSDIESAEFISGVKCIALLNIGNKSGREFSGTVIMGGSQEEEDNMKYNKIVIEFQGTRWVKQQCDLLKFLIFVPQPVSEGKVILDNSDKTMSLEDFLKNKCRLLGSVSEETVNLIKSEAILW